MPVLAVSALDVLLGLGLAAAGFVVVVAVCALVLAGLHLVLPVDSGGGERGEGEETEQVAGVDTEGDA